MMADTTKVDIDDADWTQIFQAGALAGASVDIQCHGPAAVMVRVAAAQPGAGDADMSASILFGGSAWAQGNSRKLTINASEKLWARSTSGAASLAVTG